MATNRITVLVDVTVDKAKRALDDFRRSVESADGTVGKLKAGTASIGTTLKANIVPAAAAAGAAFVAFAGDSVEKASELEQSVGGVEKAFGDAATAVLEIGKNAAETMGLSKREFNEGALALSAFAEDIARDTGKPVAEVIRDLMTRAADFAAAYGTTVPDAVRIFSSTLSGESEPIKRFGIIINDTETKAYAAEAGIEQMGKTTQRAGLLMQDTAKFAGQFASESDTLAGKQERVNANVENLQASIGQRLIPVIVTVTDVTLKAVEALEKLDAATGGGDSLFSSDFWKFGPTWDNGPGAILKEITNFDGKNANEQIERSVLNALGMGEAAGEAAAKVRSMTDAQIAAGREAHEAARKVKEIEDAYNDLKNELRDREAILNIADGFDEVKDAGVEAMTAAQSGAEDAEGKLRDYERAQIDLKDKVIDYAEAVGDIPPDKVTEILAMIDEGKLAEAEAQLTYLTRPRDIYTNIRINPRTGDFGPTITPTPRAGGGVVRPGETTLVGEQGPELVQLPSGSMVYPTGTGPGVGGVGGTVININMPPGSNGDDVVRALRDHVRRNGPIQGLT